MSNIHPSPTIPVGCYDCADGFYDPKTRNITSYSGTFLRRAGESKIYDLISSVAPSYVIIINITHYRRIL